MYLGRREVHLLLGLGLVLAVGGRRGEVPFGDLGSLLCPLRHRSNLNVWCLRFRARWTQNTSRMMNRRRPTAPATVPPIRAAVGCHVPEPWDVARLAWVVVEWEECVDVVEESVVVGS